MLIIADKRLPAEVHNSLSSCGELLLTASSGIVYDAISGHPDIFFCKVEELLCVSPGLDAAIYRTLDERHIQYVMGAKVPGKKYPATAAYNLALFGDTAVHNFDCTDEILKKLCIHHKKIQVKQGYSRCNIIPLGEYGIITSDNGIHKTVVGSGNNSLLVSSEGVVLPGFEHGFIGGCCGIHRNNVYFTGSLSHHPQGTEIKEFINKGGFNIIELYDGPLFDGGSLIFLA